MTDLDREVLVTYAEKQGIDPIEVAWHKEIYQDTILYQWTEVVVGLRVSGREIINDIKESFKGDKS